MYSCPKFWFLLWLVIHLLCEYETIFASARGNSSNIIGCKNKEREALLKIKKLFTAPYTIVELDSWVGQDCCEWQGVECDHLTSYVIACTIRGNPDFPAENELNFESTMSALQELEHLNHLELSGIDFERLNNQLIGSMMPRLRSLNLSNSWFSDQKFQLGNLTNLEVLDLSESWLSGEVPSQLANLSNLKRLDLSSNFFEIFPSQLGNLTNLEFLDLSYCVDHLHRKIMSLGWASSLLKLQTFDMSGIDLNQAVDTMEVISKLPSLSHLRLSRCNLRNTHLSHGFVNNSPILSTLRYLDLSMNLLNGSLTRNLGNLSSLHYLVLSGNAFSHVEGGIRGIMGNNPCYFKHLDLSHNNIQGEILLEPLLNASKCTSYHLEFLDLSDNQISDTFPSWVGKLTKAKYLDFSSNSIKGTVSFSHLGKLSKLTHLGMSYTNLSLNLSLDWLPPFQLDTFRASSCKIENPPKWLRTQTSITELDLSNTGLSGNLVDLLPRSSYCYSLNLSNNFLTGPFPQHFANQTLRYLDLHNNNFNGGITDWLVHLKTAYYIDLSSNKFSGNIMLSSFGKNCIISILLLKNNSLEGHIPSSLGNCTYLEGLDLSENNFSRKIPPWTDQNLPNLHVLKLQANQLGGIIPESLCHLNLQVLYLQKNKLKGKIPNCWVNSEALTIINLSANKLNGVIPSSFGGMSHLEYLHLNDNELNGHIPSCFKKLNHLKILDIGGNKLSGEVPRWFNSKRFSTLKVLRLSGNMFNSTLPNQLCSLSHLRVLDLSNNHIFGSIPSCLGNLTGINYLTPENFPDVLFYTFVNRSSDNTSQYPYRMVVFDVTRDNSVNEAIAGIIREYNTILKLLAVIDLSGNNLTGAIPEDLTKLSGLIALNLARNHLTGKIPQKIGEMKALETLDLSGNQLFGRIPTSLGNLNFLNHLNLSNNNLSGPIPTSRQLQTLDDPSVYAGNPYLCDDPLPNKCFIHNPYKKQDDDDDDDDDDDEKEKKREKMWFYLVVMSGFATGFWGVVGTLLLKKRWRHALFRLVEDASDWLYVAIVLETSRLKQMIRRDNSDE